LAHIWCLILELSSPSCDSTIKITDKCNWYKV
jgi:hypothetical protein